MDDEVLKGVSCKSKLRKAFKTQISELQKTLLKPAHEIPGLKSSNPNHARSVDKTRRKKKTVTMDESSLMNTVDTS